MAACIPFANLTDALPEHLMKMYECPVCFEVVGCVRGHPQKNFIPNPRPCANHAPPSLRVGPFQPWVILG